MVKPKFIDADIQALVNGLNQIPGVETQQSCDGHGGDGWITFACLPSMGMTLFRLAMYHEGIIIRKFTPPRTAKPGMVYLSIRLNPRWSGQSVFAMQTAFLKDLEQNGLLTEQCPFEMVSPATVAEKKAKCHPDFSRTFVSMTADKFNLIKDFIYTRWDKTLAAAQFSFAPTRLMYTNLSGNIESGAFDFLIYYKRQIPGVRNPTKFQTLCDVRWRDRKLLILFHEHKSVRPYQVSAVLEIRSPKDIEGMEDIHAHYRDVDVKGLVEVLLEV